MKRYMKLLMIMTMVLIVAALFMSSDANAIILGTAPAPAVGTTINSPVLLSGAVPLGVAPTFAPGFPPGLANKPFGLPPGLVRQPLFNPFLISPVPNPLFNPFIGVDSLGVPLGVGVNPGLAD